MLDLAVHGSAGPVTLKMIAGRQAVSLDYLEQIFRKLRQAGLVTSRRGPRGGFVLARPAARISLWEIARALGEGVAPVPCVGPESRACPRAGVCVARRFWERLGAVIQRILAEQSLEDMRAEAVRSAGSETPPCGLISHVSQSGGDRDDVASGSARGRAAETGR